MADLPFCNQCGRRLEPGARFCDLCGRKIAFEEAPLPAYPVAPSQAPPSYEIVLGEAAPRPSATAREPSAVEQKAPEPQVESKPAESLPPSQPSEARPRHIPARRFHITRRALVLSVAGVAVIAIIAVAFLGGAIKLPPLISTGTSTSTQSSSETVATQGTGPPLQVELIVAKDPVSLGNTQAIAVAVHDLNGTAISNVSVRVEILCPSGQNMISEGLTNVYGQYSYAWNIGTSPDNIGTFQVTVSATMAGYQTGYAQATFQATPG